MKPVGPRSFQDLWLSCSENLLKASRIKTGLKKEMEHTVLPYVCIQF